MEEGNQKPLALVRLPMDIDCINSDSKALAGGSAVPSIQYDGALAVLERSPDVPLGTRVRRDSLCGVDGAAGKWGHSTARQPDDRLPI